MGIVVCLNHANETFRDGADTSETDALLSHSAMALARSSLAGDSWRGSIPYAFW
jgi:hypothetical protein